MCLVKKIVVYYRELKQRTVLTVRALGVFDVFKSSVSPPLHEGLIVSTNREEVVISGGEAYADDMLRVTSERDGLVAEARGVTEDIDQAVVIASCYKLPV